MIKIPGREFDPYVTFDGVEIDVNKLKDGSVTLEEYMSVRGNSDGFTALHKKLNDEALIYVTRHYLNNCRRPSPTTYDWTLQYDIVPELLQRLEHKS